MPGTIANRPIGDAALLVPSQTAASRAFAIHFASLNAFISYEWLHVYTSQLWRVDDGFFFFFCGALMCVPYADAQKCPMPLVRYNRFSCITINSSSSSSIVSFFSSGTCQLVLWQLPFIAPKLEWVVKSCRLQYGAVVEWECLNSHKLDITRLGRCYVLCPLLFIFSQMAIVFLSFLWSSHSLNWFGHLPVNWCVLARARLATLWYIDRFGIGV